MHTPVAFWKSLCNVVALSYQWRRAWTTRNRSWTSLVERSRPPACKCLTFLVVINRFHILETTLWDTLRTLATCLWDNPEWSIPSHLDWDGVLNVYLPYWNGNQSKICDNLVESSLNVQTHLKIQGKMKHVLGGMSFPELLMRSIHAELTCLLQGHQVRILTYLYKKKIFFQSICFEH